MQTDVHDVSSTGVADRQKIPTEPSRAPLPEQELLPPGQTFRGSRCRRKRLRFSSRPPPTPHATGVASAAAAPSDSSSFLLPRESHTVSPPREPLMRPFILSTAAVFTNTVLHPEQTPVVVLRRVRPRWQMHVSGPTLSRSGSELRPSGSKCIRETIKF